MYENGDTFNDEDDIPFIKDVQESVDENGEHVVVTFDDGSKAHFHTHGILDQEYHESCLNALKLTKQALGWMKNNMWVNQKVDINKMMETSMMLGTVSKLLHTTATCISSDETERLAS